MAGFSYTQNRELSWLKFNERVLEEAYAEEVPLYERLKFIAIFTSNLDEFFMVRVGSLYDMSLDGDDQIDNKTGLSPSQQLERIYHAVEPLYKKRDRYFREVENALRAYGIADLSIDELKGDDAVFVYDYWRSCVLPVLSPQIVDDHHPFPFVANKVPHVAVELQKKKRTIMGLIPMPAALPALLDGAALLHAASSSAHRAAAARQKENFFIRGASLSDSRLNFCTAVFLPEQKPAAKAEK